MAVEIDALERLQKFVKRHPTQKDAAAALGITPAYLSDLVNMRRELSNTILAKLGLKRTVVQSRTERERRHV
jgi:plasmid maintenance system antidote protein VapI